jgi:hypothetical protein
MGNKFLLFYLYNLLVSQMELNSQLGYDLCCLVDARYFKQEVRQRDSGCKRYVRSKCIHINLATRTLEAFERGHVKRKGRISGGRPTHPTTVGTFTIHRKERRHKSSLYPKPRGGASMNYSLFFSGNQAIHEGDVEQLSHGCIHVRSKDAQWLFNWVGPNEKTYRKVIVVITDSAQRKVKWESFPTVES